MPEYAEIEVINNGVPSNIVDANKFANELCDRYADDLPDDMGKIPTEWDTAGNVSAEGDPAGFPAFMGKSPLQCDGSMPVWIPSAMDG